MEIYFNQQQLGSLLEWLYFAVNVSFFAACLSAFILACGTGDIITNKKD